MRRQRVYNIAIPATTVAAVYYIPLRIADQAVAGVKAWLSNGFVGNVHILDGRQSLVAVQARLGFAGLVDMFLTVTNGAVSEVPISADTRDLTVFVDSTAGATGVEVVTIVVEEHN